MPGDITLRVCEPLLYDMHFHILSISLRAVGTITIVIDNYFEHLINKLNKHETHRGVAIQTHQRKHRSRV